MTRSIYGAIFIGVLAAACGGSNGDSHACGDGIVNGSEQCDDGNVISGDGCSSSCQKETANTCGDGTLDVATEGCDDGNNVDGDGCDSHCRVEHVAATCGNGAIEAGETCDDGNHASADGCSATCQVETGYTCTGTPSVCTMMTSGGNGGTCAMPTVVALTGTTTLTGMGTGDTTSSMNEVPNAACGGFATGDGNDDIWQFTLTDHRDVTVTLQPSADFDPGVRVLTTPCDPSTGIATDAEPTSCSDEGFEGDPETLSFSNLAPGTYYIVVDSFEDDVFGAYTFSLTATATTCGDGVLQAGEGCDDGNSATGDGCNASCQTEPGYGCTGMPSVCASTCGNGVLDDNGEECDDGNFTNGDRCSSDCKLEYDTAEVEPNDDAAHAQVITPTHHIIKGSILPTGDDADLYTFTLTAPATVQFETYDAIDASTAYNGFGTLTTTDCRTDTSYIALFDSTGDVADDGTALYDDYFDGGYDDVNFIGQCSYIGPNDSDGDTTQGVLPAGTYTIKVEDFNFGTELKYILDIKFSTDPAAPVAPVAGDLKINEVMLADNVADTNCDGVTTDTVDEFVELVNVANHAVDLTGVTISDSVQVRHTFAAGTTGSMTLAPGKAMVVWGGGTPMCTGVTNWFVASTGSLGLNDPGDTVTIKDAGATMLATATFGASTIQKSFNLSPDVTGTAYVLHDAITGHAGTFTPGKKNDGTAF